MTVTDEQAEAFGKLFFNDWSRVYVTDEIKQIRIAKIRSALTAALALPASKVGENAEPDDLVTITLEDGRTHDYVPASKLAAADARVAELEVERDEWKRTANSPNSLETAIRLKDDAVKRWKTAEQELDEARKAITAADARIGELELIRDSHSRDTLAALNERNVARYKLGQAVNTVQPMLVRRAETAEQALAEARKALAAVDATAALNRDFNKYMIEPHAIDMVVAALRAGGK